MNLAQSQALVMDKITDVIMASVTRRRKLEPGSGDDPDAADRKAREAVEGSATTTQRNEDG